MEPLSNIGFVCDACARKPDPQFLTVPLEKFLGKYCKLAVPTPQGNHEYMWFIVTGLAEHPDEELRGELNNDPIYAEYLCGDIVEFSRKEIIASNVVGDDEWTLNNSSPELSMTELPPSKETTTAPTKKTKGKAPSPGSKPAGIKPRSNSKNS
jgi:hypothetical protein